MSSTIFQARVYFQHRWLVFWSFFVPVLFLIPPSVFSHVQDRGAPAMTMFTMIMLVTSAAFFLASVQQELLNKALCFLMPGLRKGMLNNQLLTGATIFILSLAVAFLVPGIVTIIQGSGAMALSLASLMLIVYALTLLVVFQFPYASWLPFQIIWMLAVGLKYILDVSPELIRVLLNQTSLLAFAAALVTYLAWQQMRSQAMHRKLAQRPYISIADLRNTDRMDEFKRARNLHKTEKIEATRPLDGLLQTLKRMVAECRVKGHRVRALVWEAIYLSLASAIPRVWWRLLLFLAFFPIGMAVLGYVDSRQLQTRADPMVGWFTGLVFTGLVSTMGMLAYHLRVRTMGRMTSRREMLQAGWLGTGVMLCWGLMTTLALFAMGHLFASALPSLTIGDLTYTMVAPRNYLLGLALFILPVQLLVFILWRKPGSQMVLQQSGTLAFFAYHAAFNMGGPDLVLLPIALVTAAMWLVLPWTWRWRVLQKDQV